MNQLISLISKRYCELTIKALQFYIESYNLENNEKLEINTLINWLQLQLAKSKFQDNFKSKDKV